jgi:hypothetical protein
MRRSAIVRFDNFTPKYLYFFLSSASARKAATLLTLGNPRSGMTLGNPRSGMTLGNPRSGTTLGNPRSGTTLRPLEVPGGAEDLDYGEVPEGVKRIKRRKMAQTERIIFHIPVPPGKHHTACQVNVATRFFCIATGQNCRQPPPWRFLPV